LQSISVPFDSSFVVSLPSNTIEQGSITAAQHGKNAPSFGKQQARIAPSRGQRPDTDATLGTTYCTVFRLIRGALFCAAAAAEWGKTFPELIYACT
jgi:hypothetical protein